MSYAVDDVSRAAPRDRALLQRLFLSGDDADAHFVSAGGGRVFHLHRLILSQQSRVFARMLHSAFKEGVAVAAAAAAGPGASGAAAAAAAAASSAPIVLGEVAPPVLEALFSYMYGADVPHSADAAFLCEVWEAAHRFEVAELEAVARTRTRSLLPRQPRAAFAVLAVARALRQEDMLQAAYAVMAGRLRAVAASPMLAELGVEDVMAILARPEAREGEDALALRFGMVMRWVESDLVERGPLTDSLMEYMDLSSAGPEEVEAMASRPVANESSTLMRKIAARFSELAKERRRLERKVSSLRHEVYVLTKKGQLVEDGASTNAPFKMITNNPAVASFEAACGPLVEGPVGGGGPIGGPGGAGGGAGGGQVNRMGSSPFSGASSFTDEPFGFHDTTPSGCGGNMSAAGSWQAGAYVDWQKQGWGHPQDSNGMPSWGFPNPARLPFSGQWTYPSAIWEAGRSRHAGAGVNYTPSNFGNANFWSPGTRRMW